jgi:glycosyltransferase involved in cell wall biosynthesis
MKSGLSEVIACGAPYNHGGLGRHLAQVVDEARTEGRLEQYFATAAPANDPRGRTLRLRLNFLFRFTPVRFSPSLKNYFGSSFFDRAVAKQLGRGRIFHGFDGMALYSFRRARELNYDRLELEAAMSHIDNVRQQYQRAYQAYPLEALSLSSWQDKRIRHEYDCADVIWVTSEYSRQTFLAEGVAAAKLRRRHLQIPNRFQPPRQRREDGVFRVVYTGSLTPFKGVPVLLEAFHRLPGRAELTLVGGSGSRGMRRYLESWLHRDSRMRIAPGDPLPYLQQAHVYVHPSYQDGFGYAPMEALACGVPVIVTEDTGMKENIREGVNGFVVPTEDWQAILDRLKMIRRQPLMSTSACPSCVRRELIADVAE